MSPGELIFEAETPLGHYQVYDMTYDGRPARVLYTGQRQAAQSGIPRDGQLPELLFDYNQRLFELATHLQPKRLLIIGGGAYTLASALAKVLSNTEIDIVELDPGLDKIAQDYFNWRPSSHQHVYHEDGYKFLQSSQHKYGLIVLDAYQSHAVIPPHLINDEALRLYRQHLTANGVLAVNVIAAYLGERSAVLRELAISAETDYAKVEVFPAGHGVSTWLSQNFILIAQAGDRDLKNVLRYAPLSD